MADIKYILKYPEEEGYIIGYAKNDGTHLHCIAERKVRNLPKTAQEWLKGRLCEAYFSEDLGKDVIIWKE